ncbi:MAG: hypothetical protein LBU36_00820 [Clostridiales bacterium]|jgi:hypothetical protein|nr:hypothetical protein [Clostridiales bacterium]
MDSFDLEDEFFPNEERLGYSETFLGKYPLLVKETFKTMLNMELDHHGTTVETEGRGRTLVAYQKLCDDVGESKTFTALAIRHGKAGELAERYFANLKESARREEAADEDEDAADFCKELLNNINCACTYKYDIDFKLELPESQRNVKLIAKPLYLLRFSEGEFEIDVFAAFGDGFEIKRL